MESFLLLQNRNVVQQTLIQDTQHRLQHVETQRAALEARNRILEGFALAHLGPSAGPSTAISAAAREVSSEH